MEQVIRLLHVQQSRSITLTGEIQSKRQFRNPYFLAKMVNHIGIRDGESLVHLHEEERQNRDGDDSRKSEKRMKVHDRVVDDIRGEKLPASKDNGLVFFMSKDGGRALEKQWRQQIQKQQLLHQQQQQLEMQMLKNKERVKHFVHATAMNTTNSAVNTTNHKSSADNNVHNNDSKNCIKKKRRRWDVK